MNFTETRLAGAWIVDLETRSDARGFFARAFCQTEFAEAVLAPVVAQVNLSFNVAKGTVRGLHFQYPPAAEAKLVRCTRGAIVDVIVDLRPESPSYLEHVAVELSADNRRSLYVPKRFAHGYQTLEDGTETLYQVSEVYAPASEGGLPFNDPRLAIDWPLVLSNVSDKDRQWRPLSQVEPELRARMAPAGPAATAGGPDLAGSRGRA